jgi:hypothetical protein
MNLDVILREGNRLRVCDISALKEKVTGEQRKVHNKEFHTLYFSNQRG